MKSMQNANVGTVTDVSGYMIDIQTGNSLITLMGTQGKKEINLSIHHDTLKDVIRILTAIQNCNTLGLGIRPLWAVIDGEYTGCLCMEIVRASDDGVHRDVHIVSYYHEEHKDLVGKTVFLRRDQYMPFAPSYYDDPEFMPDEEDSDEENEPLVREEIAGPILPSYLRL